MKTKFAELMDSIGWSAAFIAKMLGTNRSQVACWRCGKDARGKVCIPSEDIFAWLHSCNSVVRAVPLPKKYAQKKKAVP